MKKIVLLRHGESVWNKENRFTGWTDVDLTEKGVAEAEKAGETLREYGFNFDKAYTSYLKRAVKTLNCVLDKMNLDWIPVEKIPKLPRGQESHSQNSLSSQDRLAAYAPSVPVLPPGCLPPVHMPEDPGLSPASERFQAGRGRVPPP